ncbi:hypothetical protein [Streptomyces chattanoogensis]|uniref:hypothetical protein n=1 Tax=Streptomyces chattanoogensis TaxID=66876 RepID=UPI0036CC5395
MALYEVTRTDEVQPGQFVNAIVTASGTVQARKACARFNGDGIKGLRAERIDTTKGIRVLSVYWDERDPELSETDPIPFRM